MAGSKAGTGFPAVALGSVSYTKYITTYSSNLGAHPKQDYQILPQNLSLESCNEAPGFHVIMKTATVFQFGWLVALSVARPQHDEHNFSVGQRVHTSSGVLIGRSASEKTAVSEYLGIPFAQPPVGDLRFAAPQPYVNSGLLNTTSFVSTPFLSETLEY